MEHQWNLTISSWLFFVFHHTKRLIKLQDQFLVAVAVRCLLFFIPETLKKTCASVICAQRFLLDMSVIWGDEMTWSMPSRFKQRTGPMSDVFAVGGASFGVPKRWFTGNPCKNAQGFREKKKGAQKPTNTNIKSTTWNHVDKYEKLCNISSK